MSDARVLDLPRILPIRSADRERSRDVSRDDLSVHLSRIRGTVGSQRHRAGFAATLEGMVAVGIHQLK
jgi:hypothetical protein